MSTSTIAREVGTAALRIHNTYPDLAQLIRAKGATKGRPSSLALAKGERVRGGLGLVTTIKEAGRKRAACTSHQIQRPEPNNASRKQK